MTISDAHILVVDDDTRLRDLLKDFLGRMGYRVTTAKTAAEAEAKMQGLVFDLMVLDVMMPEETGFEFVARLRQEQPENPIPVLLLTAMGEADDRIRGFEGGADDYLVKPFEPRELVLRIQAILKRMSYMPAEGEAGQVQTYQLGRFEYNCPREELSCDGEIIKLTSGEIALMNIFAERPNQTISRHELSELISASSDRAVDVQMTRLRKKLEEDPKAPRYFQTVWGEGYIFKPGDAW